MSQVISLEYNNDFLISKFIDNTIVIIIFYYTYFNNLNIINTTYQYINFSFYNLYRYSKHFFCHQFIVQ